ncbi:hypothetical protein O3P69_006836 [Scylla paramamosain]|uniref:Uncharacterized protein n=1 Tax=Scylla paramamosain TaxID=85552 RepID=A0AAW0U1G6_SCYPA
MKTNAPIERFDHYAICSFRSGRTLIALTLQSEVLLVFNKPQGYPTTVPLEIGPVPPPPLPGPCSDTQPSSPRLAALGSWRPLDHSRPTPQSRNPVLPSAIPSRTSTGQPAPQSRTSTGQPAPQSGVTLSGRARQLLKVPPLDRAVDPCQALRKGPAPEEKAVNSMQTCTCVVSVCCDRSVRE